MHLGSPYDIATIAHTAPVRVEISDAVKAAHDDQVARNNVTAARVVPGEFRVSPTAGIQFFPEDPADSERIINLFGNRDWHLGIKASISL
jgi:hypothetical protein